MTPADAPPDMETPRLTVASLEPRARSVALDLARLVLGKPQQPEVAAEVARLLVAWGCVPDREADALVGELFEVARNGEAK